MSNTPTNAEAWDLWLESITGGHHPASLAKFAREAIVKWGTPQPVVREPLTPDQVTAAAKKLAECMDYPWDYMSYPGQAEMRKHAQAVVEAAHGITQKGGKDAE